MRPDVIKSKTDPRKYLAALVFVAFFLIINLVGWNQFLYRDMDTIFNPFLISTRLVTSNTSLFLKEFTNKSFVTGENIELKRKITEYDEVQVENKDLKEQINRLTYQTQIQASGDRKLKLVKISGVQNLYSVNPIINVEITSDEDPKVGTPVFYSKNTLFGFVNSISGKTAQVIPFYSPSLQVPIPVQNSKDPSDKGFVNKIENGSITIRNIPKSASVNIGDIWITTNDVDEVPSGVIVGKVKQVREDPSTGFKEIELELPYTLQETNYLFIAI